MGYIGVDAVENSSVSSKVSLEVCIDNRAALDVCVATKVDRIELCSSLALGGLTPSYGLMVAASQQPIPTYVMIRPHSGDFLYSSSDIELMKQDIQQVIDLGLAGVVLGARDQTMQLNVTQLTQLCEMAQGLGKTLHRVVDLIADPLLAIDQAAALGFERILSSGGKLTAIEGANQLRQMLEYSAGRLEIMGGSGITADNVSELILKTGIRAVHGSCASSLKSHSRSIDLGFSTPSMKQTDKLRITQLQAAIRNL